MKTKVRTIGLNLSDRKVAVCVLNASGKIEEEITLANERGSYLKLASDYAGSTAILESRAPHAPRSLKNVLTLKRFSAIFRRL